MKQNLYGARKHKSHK